MKPTAIFCILCASALCVSAGVTAYPKHGAALLQRGAVASVVPAGKIGVSIYMQATNEIQHATNVLGPWTTVAVIVNPVAASTNLPVTGLDFWRDKITYGPNAYYITTNSPN